MQRLLVIDDDRSTRAALLRALRSLPDVEVDEAAGGGQGLRMLGARAFDLILLDLYMPLIDGFMVLRALRSKPGLNERTPVYVVTADQSEQARARAMSMGAVFFMTKPVAMNTLVAMVEGGLKQAAREAEADARILDAKTRRA